MISRPFQLACLRLGAAAALVAASTLCSAAGTTDPVVISGLSTNPDGGNPNDPLAVTACNGAPQTGVVYRNSETEPHLAVNPTNPLNMIASWHQDRWSTGGGQSLGAAFTTDGGANWTRVTIPFTRCSGGAGTATGDYERASDPWISFAPDGTAHLMSLSFDDSVNANAQVVASSTDGGATWSAPVVIKGSPAKDSVLRSPLHDKNTLTADPYDPNLVYASWTVFRWGSTSLLFARSTDGGRTWGPARPIDNFEPVAPADLAYFRQGTQIVVRPDGTLVDVFFRILFDQRNLQVEYQQAIFRSADKGKHWEHVDTVVSVFDSITAVDPELEIPVRDAGEIPDVAINRTTGAIYIAWQDSDANSLGLSGVRVARSTDGGTTWSEPVRVNQGTSDDVQAFLPTVAVNADGTVGVLFYDFRNDTPGDAPLSTDVWLSLFSADLSYLGERRLTPASMDLRQSPLTGERGYFLGDYAGLDTAGSDFVAAFARDNDLGLPVDFPQNNNGVFVDASNRTDIVFVRVTP